MLQSKPEKLVLPRVMPLRQRTKPQQPLMRQPRLRKLLQIKLPQYLHLRQHQ
jgi:hypothetical protein